MTSSGVALTECITRADLWALAGMEAIQYASENSQCRRQDCVSPNIEHPPITFRQGRVDCTTSPDTDAEHEFPEALWTDRSLIMDYFATMFGFSVKETVAILGAHTIGQARPFSSGFRHAWVERQKTFNNQYYIDMLDAGLQWESKNVGGRRNPKYEWTSSGLIRPNTGVPVTTMMLNADMALIMEMTDVTSDGEVTGCTYDTCSKVEDEGAEWVREFAADNEFFLREFGAVFEKMIQQGYSSVDGRLVVE